MATYSYLCSTSFLSSYKYLLCNSSCATHTRCVPSSLLPQCATQALARNRRWQIHTCTQRPGFRSWLPMLRFWFRKWGTTHHLSFKRTKFKENCSPLPVCRINNGCNHYSNFPIFSVAVRQISLFLHWFLPTCAANKYTQAPHYPFTTDLQFHRTLLSDCFFPLNANIQALDSCYVQILTVRFPVPDIMTPSSSRSPASQWCTSSSHPPHLTTTAHFSGFSPGLWDIAHSMSSFTTSVISSCADFSK